MFGVSFELRALYSHCHFTTVVSAKIWYPRWIWNFDYCQMQTIARFGWPPIDTAVTVHFTAHSVRTSNYFPDHRLYNCNWSTCHECTEPNMMQNMQFLANAENKGSVGEKTNVMQIECMSEFCCILYAVSTIYLTIAIINQPWDGFCGDF